MIEIRVTCFLFSMKKSIQLIGVKLPSIVTGSQSIDDLSSAAGIKIQLLAYI